jgi:hypothetical protein
LCTAPVLGYLWPGEKYIVDMDASNMGIGVVLSQAEECREYVVAYYSRALSKAENYRVT